MRMGILDFAPALQPTGSQKGVLQVSYILWGIGMALSLIIMAMYFHRLTVHSLPDSEAIVSAFLPLGEYMANTVWSH